MNYYGYDNDSPGAAGAKAIHNTLNMIEDVCGLPHISADDHQERRRRVIAQLKYMLEKSNSKFLEDLANTSLLKKVMYGLKNRCIESISAYVMTPVKFFEINASRSSDRTYIFYFPKSTTRAIYWEVDI